MINIKNMNEKKQSISPKSVLGHLEREEQAFHRGCTIGSQSWRGLGRQHRSQLAPGERSQWETWTELCCPSNLQHTTQHAIWHYTRCTSTGKT